MSARALRVAVFGSPAFAVPTLEAVRGEHEVALVVTQPDRPAGRGLAATPPPLAARARELDLPLAQPRRLKRDAAFTERLAELDLDVAVTAAYGNLLPASLLDVPRHGFLNVHASLLPAYRGAAPIQWALIEGAQETGITIMQTEAGLDTGPIRHVARTPIGPDETAPELFARLAELGARTLAEALRLLARGELPSEPQDEARASHAPLLEKEDGRVRWSDPAPRVFDRYRGVKAWPGSFFDLGDRRVLVTGMARDEDDAGDAAPGRILRVAVDGVRVACGRGAVRLTRVRPAGRREMAAADWVHGARLGEGDSLA